MSDAHSGSPKQTVGARESSAAEDEHDLIWTLLQAVGDAVDQGEGQASISGMRDALAHHGIRLLWVEPQSTFSA